jgi:hypothetical protein
VTIENMEGRKRKGVSGREKEEERWRREMEKDKDSKENDAAIHTEALAV